jgi:homopolymeric O-antigen transport system permease protein
MISLLRHAAEYRELIIALARKNIILRYKQAYLGIAWSVLKPVMFVLIFMVMRSFVGIDSGNVPYPILTFAALMPWILFQESASEGIHSVVSNGQLIRKIYFPREVFPLTAVVTKIVEFGINGLILAALMAWYHIAPTWQILWVPVLVAYALLASLAISFAGSALNVYYRDVAAALPVVLALAMYISPIIYPLQIVKDRLLEEQAAGDWSNFLFLLYTLNPLTGLIDGFQRSVLMGLAPDWQVILPGLIATLIVVPFSYAYFKKAEAYFADMI